MIYNGSTIYNEGAGGGGTEYAAGNGIDISEGEISVKVDGTTIGMNASGQLEALNEGVNASVSYNSSTNELHLDFSPQSNS